MIAIVSRSSFYALKLEKAAISVQQWLIEAGYMQPAIPVI
jgi:hypothetical protein